MTVKGVQLVAFAGPLAHGYALAPGSVTRCSSMPVKFHKAPDARPRPRAVASCAKPALALVAAVFLALPGQAMAEDDVHIEAGAQIFEASCAGCHAGGGNVIGFARRKTLKTAALERYGFDSKDAIVNLLREGKGVMPPYGREKLTDEQASDVAEFVLSAAQRNWK